MSSREQIKRASLFAGLSEVQLDQLAAMASPCRFAEGEKLFDQEQYAEFLYLVLSGEVAVCFKPEDGKEITVARVAGGGVCGWSSILGRAAYTSKAICVVPCETLRFSGRELKHFCVSDPQTGVLILERLADVIAERLSATNAKIKTLLSHSMGSGKPIEEDN